MIEKNKTKMLQILKDPKSILGVVISMAGIYWAFKDFHFLDFIESIQQVNLFYLVFSSSSAYFFLYSSTFLAIAALKFIRILDILSNSYSPSYLTSFSSYSLLII